MGAARGHGPVHRLGYRRGALAPPPQPVAFNVDSDGGRQRGSLRHAGVLEVEPVAPRQLTGWDPGWYDGFPLYTYYFVLADLIGALLSYVVPYALAFKWITVLGSLLLPVAAWAMGRLFGMRRAYPGALAALTLCYLFDYTYTIYGGNLFSTLGR